MIYAHSVLKGYTTLRGSLFLHIPMLIAMIALVPFPAEGGDEILNRLPCKSQIYTQSFHHEFNRINNSVTDIHSYSDLLPKQMADF